MNTLKNLRYQRLIRKTRSGRDIDCVRFIGEDAETKSKDAVEKIMTAIDALVASGGQAEGGLAECTNCRLVLDQMSFDNGCPNCGSKDYDISPSSSDVRKQQ